MTAQLIGIIPAAGRGTRMAVRGGDTAKALIQVDGRPLIESAIESLLSIGVAKIIIVIGHRAEEVRQFFSARNFSVEVEFALQETQLGLPHAIASAAPLVTSDFVVLCPDNLYSEPGDLVAARTVFLNHQPPFLMVATVSPTHQHDRAKYFAAAMQRRAPHLYEYASDETLAAPGLSLNSTGCTFFCRAALQALPSFDDLREEVTFHSFLTQLAKAGQPLIYLLRGMRFDFSGPQDVEDYGGLQQRLRATTSTGVSAILINSEGHVLLQHRDDNPSIRYPGHWALWGGTIEPGETAHAAACREILEETGYNIENLGLFRQFVQNGKREFAFAGEIDASLDELSLGEGQAMNFVRPQDLPKLLIRPDDKETLKAYFGDWDE
jgi:NDP-sugar pyrophosphorylase family protein